MKVSGRNRLKRYYQGKAVASGYLEKRFSAPIYSSEHDKQVAILNSIISRYRPKKVLEIAPGPARITVDIKTGGTAIDNSKSMLSIARKRSKKSKYMWNFVRGDAFNLKFPPESFDMVYTFRFIRHFKLKERKRIYAEVRKVLKAGGFFVFEIPNRKKNLIVRKMVGEEKYNVYDFMTDERQIKEEIVSEGFEVIQMIGTSTHFFTQVLISKISEFFRINNLGKKAIGMVEKIHSKTPLEWVIICRKRK